MLNQFQLKYHQSSIKKYFPFPSLVFIQAGQGQLTTDLGWQLVQEDNILLIPAWLSYSIQAKSPRISFVTLEMRGNYPLLPKINHVNGIFILKVGSQKIPTLINLLSLENASQPWYKENYDHYLQLILNDLLLFADSEQAFQEVSQPIQKAITFLQANYQHPIKFEDLMAFTGLSRSHLSYLFKAEVGQTYSEYLLNLRLEKALDLLRQYSIPLQEIAQSCGFNNYSYFSKCFQNKYHMSPKTFIKSLENKKISDPS